jgi:indolepyruvate ferredoxin oxidoreductase
MTETVERSVRLEDRYELREGAVQLTGLQALVRLPMEQSRRDRAAGRSTATLISGYEGSPLAGYDLELPRQAKLLEEHRIRLLPAVNEELAANAVQGSQLASASDDRTADGVVGIWYGKAPGLDRATDALRHGNLGGADRRGGVLVLVGDDSIAKSSTVPSSSETALAEIGMPVLAPCDARDVLELGLHGIALSRFCGLWTAVKLATNVVDGGATVELDAEGPEIVTPDRKINGKPFVHQVSAMFLGTNLAELEATQTNERVELARRYARANQLNRVGGDSNGRVGVIAAGPTYLDVTQALRMLGIADDDVSTSGVKLLKLGMVSPLHPGEIAEFAEGLDEIVVVEEKRPLIEHAVKDILYGRADAPHVSGRHAPDGSALLRANADLPPDVIAQALGQRLRAVLNHAGAAAWLERAAAGTSRPVPHKLLALASRTPYFCSGCPHNRSTHVPEGSLVGAGIGCSALAAYVPEQRSGQILGLTQMGGEGAMWIGMSPFVHRQHLIQNIGDGTFHHSGSLAVRAAVAAGTRITFKLLYNGAVAMTGGQQAVGNMPVAALTRSLLAEGVARVVITTETPRDYRRRDLPRGVKVRHRDDLIQVQEELAAIDGVTVLIHEQECATELRRKRKRGLAEDRATRLVINERVCEGCGDCGYKSNCLSVQPVDTDYGRKTRIHQASCNKDYSCLDGDCPSFVTIRPPASRPTKKADAGAGTRTRGSGPRGAPGAATRRGREILAADFAPDPVVKVRADDYNLRITGIGGTGVVTVAQVVSAAATIAGLYVRNLDQMGMAQKGGAVVSDVRLSRRPLTESNKVGTAECDLYLGCDLLVAALPANLAVADPERTITVLSTAEVPTGEMVTDLDSLYPDGGARIDAITASTRRSEDVIFDARQATLDLFGDDQFANVLLLGAAAQAGAIPIAPRHIEAALELNDVAVDGNLQAFRHGRRIVLEAAAEHDEAGAAGASAEQTGSSAETWTDLLERRASELVDYQGGKLAEYYRRQVARVVEGERAAVGHAGSVTIGFAEGLFKLLAYKDEYEVARLYLDPSFEQQIAAQFGPGARIRYQLHPPLLRGLGMRRKISLGPWFKPVLRLLRAARRLRGTPLDVFGYAGVRRLERQLADEYVADVFTAMHVLTPETHECVERLVRLPDRVRGYDDVKLRNVELYRTEMAAALASLRGDDARD